MFGGICGIGALGVFALWLGIRLRAPAPAVIPAQALAIDVLSVGNGEAAWVKTPTGHFVVIGAGPPGSGERLAASLKSAGASKIDLLILPYPYAESLGGAPELLARLPADAAIDNGWARINNQQQAAQAALQAHGIKADFGRAGMVRRIDGLTVEVLAPSDPAVTRSPAAANNALVVKLTWRDIKLLFCGGIEEGGERALLGRRASVRADWVRLPRFGGPGVASPELLRRVAPRIAVLSIAGRPDTPAPAVLERLKASGASVYRTDSGRDLLFYSDGRTIKSAQ